MNEFKCALGAANGTRMPSAAGVRMGNEKYMFIRNDPESGVSTLSRAGGGGASIGKLKSCIVIGIWHKNEQMSTGTPQNAGDVSIIVETMTEFLKKADY